jgi:hypothetical protein
MKATEDWRGFILFFILVWLEGIIPGGWTAPVSASPVDKPGDIKIIHPPLCFEA